MIYVREPSENEHQELTRMTRQEIGRVSQRAQVVLLLARRQTVPQIAYIFNISRASVRFWLRRFDERGPVGLYEEERCGRSLKMTLAVKETLIGLVEKDPQEAGNLATFWTVAMLTLALLNKEGIRISPCRVRQTLQNLGLGWGRPRLSMPDKVDPDKAAKQWAIVNAVVEAPPQTVVLYADESRLQLLPLLRAMWHWVGQPIRIPTPGTNVTRSLFGALNINTGRWSYLVRHYARAEDFLGFLEYLLSVYPDVPIILIVDNFSSHIAHAVVDWLRVHSRLRLFYLPLYCSHLNPVEPIWLRLKGHLAANRLYASMTLLVQTVEQFFQQMTPQRALQWSAVGNV